MSDARGNSILLYKPYLQTDVSSVNFKKKKKVIEKMIYYVVKCATNYIHCYVGFSIFFFPGHLLLLSFCCKSIFLIFYRILLLYLRIRRLKVGPLREVIGRQSYPQFFSERLTSELGWASFQYKYITLCANIEYRWWCGG